MSHIFKVEDEYKSEDEFVSFFLKRASKNLSKNSMPTVVVPVSRLSDDFHNLLRSGACSDVILTCKGEQFRAHKMILACRSLVFAAMFKHELKEKKHSIVEIVDMEKDVLKELLKYMYTDKVDGLEKLANGLLAAADKYDLERLRIMCEKSLAASLSVENVADTLTVADTHSADQLKKVAIQFLISHKADVIKTIGWKRMSTEQVHLVVEAFEYMSNN